MAATIAHDALAMIEYGPVPSILVMADSASARERARRSIEAAGCRVSDSVPLADACGRLDEQVALDAAWLEIEADGGAALDRLLDRLEWGAHGQRFGSVVSAPAALIDAVAARTHHARIHHLCNASELERVTALALAAARPAERLHDVRKQQGPARLQQLSEEVGRIANILATLSSDEAPAPPLGAAPEGGSGIDAGQVKSIIRARRLRDQYFSAELFADPAWDMLLDLMAARLERSQVAVSSLCIAAAVPATTALRWIKTLTDAGLFVRQADPKDGRRVYIELSEEAAAGMAAYLQAALRISPVGA